VREYVRGRVLDKKGAEGVYSMRNVVIVFSLLQQLNLCRKRREGERARRMDLPSMVNRTCIYIIAILFIIFNG
jgi:hypothetical protein